MDDPDRVSRLLLETATTLAQATDARAIIAYIGALPDLDAVPPHTVLVTRDDEDAARAEKLGAERVAVPDVTLDRFGQVTLAAIVVLSSRLVNIGDRVVFLSGPYRSPIDSLVVMSIGAEYELFDSTGQPGIEEHIKRAVFHRVLTLALSLGMHGREGRRSGALLVVGDASQVLEYSEQMILNPFHGYEEASRNVLDERMTETVKEFSSLDGAFIIRGDGVIETAGARIRVGISEGLPSGLGSRHAAAAGITANTRAIAFTVSGSDGTVRVWRAGKLVATLEPHER